MPSRTCPDCDVGMNRATQETTNDAAKLRVGSRQRLHGRYGSKLQAFVCPECRLVRFYAD